MFGMSFEPHSYAGGADTFDPCPKIMAEARSAAALGLSPSLAVQAFRLPIVAADPTLSTGNGYDAELRIALDYNLAAAYQGIRRLHQGEVECQRERAVVAVQKRLISLPDLGRGNALRAELAYLQDHRLELKSLVGETEARLEKGLISYVELTDVRFLIDNLERRVIDLEGELRKLTDPGSQPPRVAMEAALKTLESASVEADQAAASVRNVDPWNLRMRGGMVAAPYRDWFGVVELSYNFGGPFRAASESARVAAHAEELKSDPRSLRALSRQAEADTRESLPGLEQTLALLDREIGILRDDIAHFGTLTASAAPQFVTLAKVRVVLLEADAKFARTLLQEREGWLQEQGQSGRSHPGG